jgi:glycosyltransferase involved in cell wall biosynthesis
MKLKHEKSIEVLGYHKNIPELYAKSHIVCLPSYREGLPKSLMEAAAASRAVVTTDVPGCRDAIIPNKTGLLVPVKDPYKLADSLQWLIEHPKERIAMGKEGRKLAEKEFRIEKIVQDHLYIYKQLISNGC